MTAHRKGKGERTRRNSNMKKVKKNDEKNWTIEDLEYAQQDIDNGKMVDAFTQYMQEVKSILQMTPAQEVEVAKRIEVGDEEAKKELAKANLWLVCCIAQNHVNRGLSFMDLVQEGNIGLIKAIEKFDYRHGKRFSSYAGFAIKQQMIAAIAENGSTFRNSINKLYTYYRISITNHNLKQTLDRMPTTTDIAEEMNISESYVTDILLRFTEPVSLDELGENVADTEEALESKILPEQVILQKERDKRISEAFRILTPQEAIIIRMFFGFDNGREYTTAEIAKVFHISRQRVEYLKKRALNKIRDDLTTDDMELLAR